jgi:hypothetical protein
MRATIANHWWGFKGGRKKMHWKSWDCLTTPKFMGGMGFKDMKIFNQAMLAGQCWRLITDSNSLCAKVLKGRYFPSGSFLDSNSTRSCSFTWRSLMFGKQLLMQGILWRIGDGESVRITKDRWVLEAPCCPIKPKIYILEDLRVSALMDRSTRQGNAELIAACFSPLDAGRILNIPLSSNSITDYVSWPFTKNGTFTVKSAYIMAKREQVLKKISSEDKGETSNQSQTARDWKRLWSIKAPPKMLIVLWRFAHNCLPTGQQLKHKNIQAYEGCPHCGREENLYHTFMGCPYVHMMWRNLQRRCGFKLNKIWYGSQSAWLFEFLQRC